MRGRVAKECADFGWRWRLCRVDHRCPAEYADKLQRLYQFAQSLEDDGIAALTTSIGQNRAFLRIRFPGLDTGLVNIVNNGGYGYAQFNGRQFDQYAPTAKQKLEKITGKGVNPSTTYWGDISDSFLETLSDAYREDSDSLQLGD